MRDEYAFFLSLFYSNHFCASDIESEIEPKEPNYRDNKTFFVWLCSLYFMSPKRNVIYINKARKCNWKVVVFVNIIGLLIN